MKKITTYLKSRSIRLQLGIYFLIILLPVSIYLLRHPLFARADSHIKFNEGVGATINDSKGSASGSITGATWKPQSECISGSCLFFDGSGDYVSFGDNGNFDFTAASNFTIEFWFRTTDITSGTRVFVSKYRGNDAEGGYKVYMSADGKINFGVDDDNSFGPDDIATSTNTYDDNLWHHVVATKTGTTNIKLYVDAVLVGQDESISATGTLVNNDPLIVGIDSDLSSNPYTGYLDDLKIFITTARTSNQVITDYQVGSSLSGASARFGPNTTSLSNGLIGYWKFDETSGNATDSSGNNITLTNNGTTTYVLGKYGKGSEHVPASTQYLSTATTINNVATVSFWANPDSNTNYFMSLTSGAYLTASSGTLSATGFTNPTIYINGVESNTVVADTWQFITITTNTAIDANQFYVSRVGSNYYDGTLDEVRLYNRALSPIEVQQLYDWAPGPVVWWKMDEKTGTSIYDISGNNNTGTFKNSPTWTNGKYGNAIQFDGINSYIAVADSNSLDFTTNFTLSAWIKPDTVAPQWQNIFVKGPDANTTPARNYAFYLNYDEFDISWYNNGWRDTTTTNVNLVPGNWYHVVYTRDASHEKIYINGVKVYDAAFAYAMIANNDEFQIGERYFVAAGGDVHPYQGVLDEVKFYNYVRTPAQIISDMNADHPAPGSPIGSALLHYKLDEGYGSVANNLGNTGSGQNGTISNGTWSNSGKLGKAVTFSATTSITTTITDPAYANTISIWVYPTTSAASKTLVTSDKLATNASSQPTYGSCIGTALELDTWTHIMAVSDNSNSCKIYQNGVQTASNTTGVSFGTSVNIGGSSFTGLIDEFKLYNFGLTATSAQAEFNQGKAAVFGAISTESDGTTPSFSANRQYCVPGDTNTCNPPVAEWKFEEKTGQYAADVSGNNLYMTLGYNSSVNTSDPSWGTGKFGNGLYFDGNDYAKAADHATLTPADDMTLTFWFRLNQYASTAGRSYYLIDKAHGSTPYHSYQCYINDSTDELNCLWFNSAGTYWGDAYTTFDPQLNTWYFASFVKQGTTTQLRINNIPDSNGGYTNLTGTILDSDGSFSIGANTGAYQSYLDGQLDEIKLYNYARTPAQLAWDYNRGSPLSRWRLDENTGTTAYDTSGNNNTGTWNGTLSNLWTVGKYGTAGNFNGTNNMISTNNGNSVKGLSQFTIEGWINTNVLDNTVRYIYSEPINSSASLRVEFSISSDNQLYFGGRSTDAGGYITWVDDNRSLVTDAWYHVAAVFDSITDTHSIYINGEPTNQSASVSSIQNTSPYRVPRIGSDPSLTPANLFSGKIDDLKVYNYALTPTQIKNIINNSSTVHFDN